MAEFDRHWRPSLPEPDSNQLAFRAEELKAALQSRDPALVAARSGVSLLTTGPGRGELHIPLLRRVCILSWPELMAYDAQDNPLPGFHRALLLYYLITADGTAQTGRWVSFAELPGGRMYNAAFQGYSGDQIVKSFGLNLTSFRAACESAGGKETEVGNSSFIFQALPRLPLLVTYWLGDEDFPSSCKILFDESVDHYLPIDVCAILGSMLTRKLIQPRETAS